MFSNYLTTSLRILLKQKAFSVINVFGLAVGLAASMLILIYVQYELSYDSHNEKLDRIYRVSLIASVGGNDVEVAATPYPMAATLVNEFPEVETAARFRRFFSETLVGRDDIAYQESEIFHADPQLLDIFSFNFLAGDQATALNQPNSIVITRTIAEKYFGSQDALGEVLRFNNARDYEITGIIEEVPANAHFHPDIMVSFTSDSQHDLQLWVMNNINTYVLLRPDSNLADVEQKLSELVPKDVAPQIEEGIGTTFEDFLAGGGYWNYELMPVSDIHLYSTLEDEIEPPGSAAYVYTFQAVAFFILILACVNFMNLSTARSANRAKEIGIRKTVGATQLQLIFQFLTESLLISFISLLLALPIVGALLPVLNAITDRSMSFATFADPAFIGMLSGIVLAVGLFSGSYPALFLSRFQPREVLKGNLARGGGSIWVRGSLVIFQITISVALITATLIVHDQLEFLRNKPLGFDKEQVIIVERAAALGDQLEAFKTRIAAQPGVSSISSAAHLPREGGDQNAFQIVGRPASETEVLHRLTVSYDYLQTLGIELTLGRTFSREFTGNHSGYIINETGVRELEFDDPLEISLAEPDQDGLSVGPIIGVVSDFHFLSLHQAIEPMVLRIGEQTRYVIVRVTPGKIEAVVSELGDTWSEMTGGEPFSYSFLDEEFDALHQGEQKVGELFIGFSVLAVLIASLGLYGLTSYSTQQRTKEIGIRKTLGATVGSIIMLMNREFLGFVAAGIVIAAPLTFLAMSQWLELFAYRIEINPLVFLLSAVVAIGIAFLTVSIQSLSAARVSLSLCLRTE